MMLPLKVIAFCYSDKRGRTLRKGFGESRDYVQGGRFQATFHLTDIGRVNTTPERQTLL